MLQGAPSANSGQLLERSHTGMTSDSSSSNAMFSSAFASTSAAQGLKVVAFVVNTTSCRNALLTAKPLLVGRCATLSLVHCLSGDASFSSMHAALQTYANLMAAESGMEVNVEILIRKMAEQTVSEALAEHVESTQPDLVLIACSVSSRPAHAPIPAAPSSQAASVAPGSAYGSPAHRSSGAGVQSLTSSPAHARQSLSLKICQDITSVPVLLAKPDPRSAMLPHQTLARPVTCMIDLQSTSRGMVDWVADFLDPKRDKLLLAATNALERDGSTRAMASRILTAFSVQAKISGYRVLQRPLRGEPQQALPQAIGEDKVNLLVTQAPRSRYLAPWMVGMVQSVPASVLIWPSTQDRTSRTSPSETKLVGGFSLEPSLQSAPSLPPLRPRSISSETGSALLQHTAEVTDSLLIFRRPSSCGGSDVGAVSRPSTSGIAGAGSRPSSGREAEGGSRPRTPKLPELRLAASTKQRSPSPTKHRTSAAR